MKRFVKIFAISILFISCVACAGSGGKNSGKDAKAVADNFLTSYFAGEYDKAVTFCTDTLASSIREAVADQEFDTEEVKNAVMEMSKNTRVVIGDVHNGETKNDCTVSYELSLPDSTKLNSQVSMIKVDGVWKVLSL
jgi:hypothetical protein